MDHTDFLHEIFLNTNNGFFTRDFLYTNLTNNTNLFGMRIFLFFYTHTELMDLTDLFAYGSS